MADIISRLKLESGEFDAKIKRAGQELLAYSEHCKKTGLQMGFANKDAVAFAKSLGSMQTVSQTARGKINELSEAFINAKVMYKNMTDAEKNNEFGRNLAASLDQLKSRLNAAKKDLADVQQEINASGNKFGQFGSIIDGIGQKMGINANITELLTSKTALMSAGIGAATAIIGKATQEWAKYNAELARQDKITTVTTGLKGPAADTMTDQARAIVDTYGTDFREVINAANTLMTQFGQTGEQSMKLISDGMQGMIQGDGPKLLSMIQHFAPSFRDAGISASQLVAIIQNSEGGIFTDQNMNAIVMGIKNIRLMTNSTAEALGKLGINGQEMTRKLNDGSMTIFQAMQQVTTAINNAGSSSQAVGEVMQQVFGRQGAAAGAKLGEAIATLNTNLEETKRQTGEVGDAYNQLYEANVKLNGAIRDCFEYDGWEQMATGIKANLVSILASVLDYLSKIKGALGGFSVSQQQGDTMNGGGSFIDRAVDRLKGGSTPGKQNIYNRQVQAYSGKILDINDQIRQIEEKAAADMDGNMALVYEKQIRNLENRKAAIKRNMDEYIRRADKVLNDTGTPSDLGGGSSGGSGISHGGSAKTDSIEKIQQQFDKAMLKSAAGAASLKPEDVLGPSDAWEAITADIRSGIKGIDDEMQNLTPPSTWTENFKPYMELVDDMTKKQHQLAAAQHLGAQAAQNFGAALQGIDDPAAKAAGTVMQAVASIALGFAMASSSKNTAGTGWGWLAWLAAGTAAMATTIATVHSLTGFQNGGVVKGYANGGIADGRGGGMISGTTFSNDQIPIMANAGEVILNRAQANGLAADLQQSERTVRVVGKLKGSDIFIAADRWAQESGHGQLMTWG